MNMKILTNNDQICELAANTNWKGYKEKKQKLSVHALIN